MPHSDRYDKAEEYRRGRRYDQRTFRTRAIFILVVILLILLLAFVLFRSAVSIQDVHQTISLF